jgi:hypothetical protein
MLVEKIGSERPAREQLMLPSAFQHAEDGEQEEQPWATLVLLLCYLIVLIGLWAAIYMLLLDRA